MYIACKLSYHNHCYRQFFISSHNNKSLSIRERLVVYSYNLFIVKSSVAAGTKRNVVSAVLTTVFSSFNVSANSSK